MTLHNLTTLQLTAQDYQLLTKGLSFSPTPTTSAEVLQQQIFQSFNDFARSLRLKFMRIRHTNQTQHQYSQKPTTTSYLYRSMKFLHKPKPETQLERYTDVGQLENYIERTKQQIADSLNALGDNGTPNLSRTQRTALSKLQRSRHTLTIKPADKNLGVVLMHTNDYITQCMLHLTDSTTYRLATNYPAEDIKRELQHAVAAYKPQLETRHKHLYSFLRDGPRQPRTPHFYGIPKIHKTFQKLPPMRPIVSQTSSILSHTAQFIDYILQPLARSYPDYLHNSTGLSLVLQDLSVPDDALLVSIDVVSLYPSIPQSQCLDIIYKEMHTHSDLFTVDPNLLIRLLHININYNYFAFSHLIFQQVKGTAMGAAFSPTIANIFMSTIMRDFLRTQDIKPLVLTRYIDDSFLVWTGTTQELTHFLSQLNSFHPNLRFTHEHSSHTINFLDLTIFKSPHFSLTNILDTKTYQKPLNLYQYLHFSSTHPSNVFKSIIRGECIRYARTNTSYETFAATVHMFKQRLGKRGYPHIFVNKVIKTVNYNNRQKLLNYQQPIQPTCYPPLFKCLPPPQYQLLKRIILQKYSDLHFISPRFISLRHPTLHNLLVRAQLKPTDEQLIDITFSLASNEPTNHITSAKLPNLCRTAATITPCRHPRCVTCRYHLDCHPTFQSTHPRNYTTYRIRHSLTCTSSYLIYLITCTKCKKQYVGCTQQQLNIRMNHHRTNIINRCHIHICQHFNLPGHTLNDHLKVQPIDSADKSDHKVQELYRLERYWISTLRTITPHGLNISPGNTGI